MATFNEQNNTALGFVAGLMRGISPTLLGQLEQEKKRKEAEKALQLKNDAEIYKQGQDNYRANLKIKAEAKAKADEWDNKRRAAVLDRSNKTLLKSIDRDIATDRNISRENVARIRNKKPVGTGDTNYYQGYGSGYTESDAQVFDKMANDAIKSADTGKSIGGEVVGATKEQNRQLAAKFRVIAQKIRSGEKPTAEEKKIIDEYLNFAPPAAKLEPYSGAGPTMNELQEDKTPPAAKLPVNNAAWEEIPPELKDSVIALLQVPPAEAAKVYNNLPLSQQKLLLRSLQAQPQQKLQAQPQQNQTGQNRIDIQGIFQ